MDITTLSSVITTVGFPIAMCIIMMLYVKELNDKQSSESKYMTEAINKNTLVIQKLCDQLNIDVENK